MSPLLSRPRESLVLHVLRPAARGGEIALRYRLAARDGADAIDLTERVRLPDAGPTAGPDAPALPEAGLRLLALAAALSYYKTCVPATVVVEDGLTPTERRFLTEVVRHGLGEFAYRNDVPEALHPTIEADDRPEPTPGPDADRPGPRRALVAVGGGKDSIVTIESLRALPVGVTLFSVNDYAPIRRTAQAAGLDLVVASRTLDPQLFALNDAGALNGHVPVTAVNSLVACLTAVRLGLDDVVFSNEASSSFGNLTWAGVEVNHQWSKGLAFERLLREATASLPVTYLSFLRPLSELAIMRRFATLERYLPVFTSCNRAFHLDPAKQRSWCGDCPKCRFVFLCLAPFLPRAALLEVFAGRDLLADPDQREGLLELLDVGGRLKPFECVGEPAECRTALRLLAAHPDWRDHPFLRDPEVAPAVATEEEAARAFAFVPDHCLPDLYERAARAVL